MVSIYITFPFYFVLSAMCDPIRMPHDVTILPDLVVGMEEGTGTFTRQHYDSSGIRQNSSNHETNWQNTFAYKIELYIPLIAAAILSAINATFLYMLFNDVRLIVLIYFVVFLAYFLVIVIIDLLKFRSNVNTVNVTNIRNRLQNVHMLFVALHMVCLMGLVLYASIAVYFAKQQN